MYSIVVILTIVFSCIGMIYNYRMWRNVLVWAPRPNIQWIIKNWILDPHSHRSFSLFLPRVWQVSYFNPPLNEIHPWMTPKHKGSPNHHSNHLPPELQASMNSVNDKIYCENKKKSVTSPHRPGPIFFSPKIGNKRKGFSWSRIMLRKSTKSYPFSI